MWHIALDPTELGCASRDKVIVQQRRKVQLALGGGVTFEHFQQVGTANQVGQLAHAKHGQNFAHLFGNEAEIVLDHLYGAAEMLVTQILVLRGNPGSAIIEMTDAQVLATQRHHWRRAKAKAFGSQNRSLDHVKAGFQTAIGLEPDPVTQAIDAQCLMHLGQPQLPGTAGILD